MIVAYAPMNVVYAPMNVAYCIFFKQFSAEKDMLTNYYFKI